MNDPLPAGNGNIVDIFVVSTCTSESPVQVAILDELGYRVTCFPDSSQLFESLRSGKPNLLIADSVTLGEAAYTLCRTLKADPDLWIIPVLVVTGASSLSDLLYVLDCNADNFISTPYDAAYLSAVIEGLLATPVERPTPEQIKTQFKIQHDGQLFVVTADRRKLLEFLLSSFEIAVSRSGEILRISSRNDELASSLETANVQVQDQAAALDSHTRTIDNNEQSIRSLQEDLAGRHRQIQDHTDEITRLEQELKGRDARIAGLEDQTAGLTADLQALNSRYTSETGDLRQQVASLTGCLTSSHTDLDAIRESIVEEKKRKAETDARLLESESARKKAEESLQDVALDLEQVRNALSTERVRADAAEHEAKTVLQAKNEAEQDLIRTVNEFKDAIQRQDVEILQFKDALAARDARIAVLENRAAELESEKTYAHAEIQSRAESASATISGLNTKIEELTAALSAKEEELGSRDADLSRIGEEKNGLAQDLHARSEKLVQLETALKDAELRHREAIDSVHGEIHDRESRIGELENDLRSAQDECESYRHSLETVRYELGEVTEIRSGLEAGLDEARTRIHSLEEDHRVATTTVASASQDVERLTRELADVHRDLEGIRQQHQDAEQALRTEREDRKQATEILQDVTRERDAALQDLGNEQRLHADATAEKERLLQQIEASVQDRQNQDAGFEARVSALSSELDRSRSAFHDLDLQAADLMKGKQQAEEQYASQSAELERSRSACHDLELQVAALSKQKEDAEERVASLSVEIDQARTALADEWEDHMNARERLDAAVSDQPAIPPETTAELDLEKARKRSLIIKGPDLPANIGNQVHALSIFSGSPVEPEAPRITNVEDLFEDEESGGSMADSPQEAIVPSVSIVHEHSGRDIRDEDEESTADSEAADPDTKLTAPADTPDEEEADETPAPSPRLEEAEHMPVHFTFNRTQWFDLLKWSHHAGTLSQEQRMQIVRMGRLIQQGRKLTPKQEELVMEMLLRAQAQGFQLR